MSSMCSIIIKSKTTFLFKLIFNSQINFLSNIFGNGKFKQNASPIVVYHWKFYLSFPGHLN